MADPIHIKGIRDGLLVTLDEADSWEDASRALLSRIDSTPDFFHGARLALAVGTRALSAAEMGRLRDTLSERQVGLAAVLSDAPSTQTAAQALGLMIELPSSVPQSRPDPEVDPEEAREGAVLVRRTLRSGRSVRHTGHIVVIGDVNPGAEVIAGGNVVVWGRLRGVVHAGAPFADLAPEGDAEAMVCALDLSPTQLRIAGLIATSPNRRGDPQPEMARIRSGHIIAERWSAKSR